jgi:hypothetical protein
MSLMSTLNATHINNSYISKYSVNFQFHDSVRMSQFKMLQWSFIMHNKCLHYMYTHVVGGLYYHVNLKFVFKLLTHVLSDMLHCQLSQFQWQLAVQHTAKLLSSRLYYIDDTDISIQSGAKNLLALHHCA